LEPGRFGLIGIFVFDGASPNLQGILASVFEEAKLWGLPGAMGFTLLIDWILGLPNCLAPWLFIPCLCFSTKRWLFVSLLFGVSLTPFSS